jgi:hypothetical protein
VQSFVVRIYRRDRRARRFVGVVEEAGVEGRRAFTTLDELWSILTVSRRETTPPRRSPSPRPPGPSET